MVILPKLCHCTASCPPLLFLFFSTISIPLPCHLLQYPPPLPSLQPLPLISSRAPPETNGRDPKSDGPTARRHVTDQGVRRGARLGNAEGSAPRPLRDVRRDLGSRHHLRQAHGPIQGLRLRDLQGRGRGEEGVRRPDSGDQRPPRELQPRVARREGEAPILAAEWAGRWLESGDIRGAAGAGAVVLPPDRYTTVSCSITPPLPRSSALLPRRLRILPELCDRLGLQREGKPKPLSWGRAILLPRARWNGCTECNAACVSFLPLPTSPFAWHGDPCTLLPSDYCHHSYRRLQAYCSASSSSLCGSGTSHRMQLNNSKRGGGF